MNLKAFFVTALSQALELSIATPDDVLRHVTPDVLATHLPRPLWARLLTACLGAARVDAQLVVDTIGVPNLCECVPDLVIWACISEIGRRAIGVDPIAKPPLSIGTPPREAHRAPITTPPPIVGPSIPPPTQSLADVVAALEADEHASSSPQRTRTPTQPRIRQSNTGIGRLANARRPQASASPAVEAVRPEVRRPATESDYDMETVVKEDWKLAEIEDDELHDWPPEETVTQAARDNDIGRKR